MSLLSLIATQIRASATGRCRLPAPLSWRLLTRDRASAVQRAILLEYLRTGSTAARLLGLGIALLFWPFRSFAQAWKQTRAVGGQVTGIRSRPAQFAQQLRLAWFHGISPDLYYQMGVARAKARVNPMEWLQNGHGGLLSRVFRDEKTLPEINDKLLFARVMERSSVPTPPIIAVFDGGQQIAGLTGPALVGEVERYVGLFVKPVRSSGGKDSVLWERQPNGTWVYRVSSRPGEGLQRALNSQDHRAFSSEEWLEWLLRLSASGGLLVQQRLTNHPQLSLLGVPELISLRILTGLGQAGVIVLRAVLYLPFRNSIHSQHGLKSAVRLEDGVLGPLFHSSVDQRFFAAMETNGSSIAGTVLPYWASAVAMVKQGHLALPDYVFLGWDLAITPEGPVVLEANGNFATASLQKPDSRPLIDEQFLSIFDFWREKGRVGSRA